MPLHIRDKKQVIMSGDSTYQANQYHLDYIHVTLYAAIIQPNMRFNQLSLYPAPWTFY